jgi:hypothetical protein
MAADVPRRPGATGLAAAYEDGVERRLDSRKPRDPQHLSTAHRKHERERPLTTAASELRRQRDVERLHPLGARALSEFLNELARRNPAVAPDIDRRLTAYTTRLSPELLRAVGGDRFPVAPLRAVPRFFRGAKS